MASARRLLGDALVRPRLQGPPRLPVGMAGHRLTPALAAAPPQHQRPARAGVLLLPRSRPPAGLPAHADRRRREEMAGGGMPPAGKRTGRLRRPPGPALAVLPPAHRAVHVRARPARR